MGNTVTVKKVHKKIDAVPQVSLAKLPAPLQERVVKMAFCVL